MRAGRRDRRVADEVVRKWRAAFDRGDVSIGEVARQTGLSRAAARRMLFRHTYRDVGATRAPSCTDEAVYLLREQGLVYPEIAERLGINRETARHHDRRWRRRLSAERALTRTERVRVMRNRGLSPSEIGRELDITRQSVWYHLRRSKTAKTYLTDEQVTAMRNAAWDGASAEELAERFQVSMGHCLRVLRGQERDSTVPALRNADIVREERRTAHHRKLDDAAVVDARSRFASGAASIRQIARELGCGYSTARKMLRGETYKHLNESPRQLGDP